MSNLSTEYLELLRELRRAPLTEVLYQHQLFWLKGRNTLNQDLNSKQFTAYHLGTVPRKIPTPLRDNWFLDPQICLQRVALYADIIVFDDLVGHILAKSPHISKESWGIIYDQVQGAIEVLIGLYDWAKAGIVKILPSDLVLSKIYEDYRFPILNALSATQASGELPDVVMNILSNEQRQALSISAGQALIYKVNKALLLKEQFDFTLSADDTFHDIICEALKWNHKELGDISNIYLLKKIRAKYFCNSTDLVFELRKQDKLAGMRKFFREEINGFFGDDIRSRSNQTNIDEFSRVLLDKVKEADSELDILKRKFGSDVVINLALAGTSMLLALAVDYGGNFASWIPQVAGSIPAVKAGTNIIDALKTYINESSEIKVKPTFILGSQMGKES